MGHGSERGVVIYPFYPEIKQMELSKRKSRLENYVNTLKNIEDDIINKRIIKCNISEVRTQLAISETMLDLINFMIDSGYWKE